MKVIISIFSILLGIFLIVEGFIIAKGYRPIIIPFLLIGSLLIALGSKCLEIYY